MRSAIPSFSTIIRPLSDLLESVYQTAGKRTRLSVAKVSLANTGWSAEHDMAFRACKEALQYQVTLAHVDFSKRLCVFTDASELHWSGVVTQIPLADLSSAAAYQRHEPLDFLSGHFRGPELRWSTLEKEACAIMATVERMHWFLATDRGFDMSTDHNNLVFLFDPLAVVADLSQTTLRKVLRWRFV